MPTTRRLLVIGSESPYGWEVLSGIHAYGAEHGPWEYHFESDRAPMLEKRCRFAFRRWKADGIIAQIRSERVEKVVRSSRLPVVNFSGAYDFNLPTVKVDSDAVGRMIARHFLDNGARHFAFCGRGVEDVTKLRCEGFVDELRRAAHVCNVFSDDFGGDNEPVWVKNRQRMDRWLVSLKKPVAMMCVHDLRGQEVSWACSRLGLRVPDDIALAGVGDDPVLCRMCAPPLTSVDTGATLIGYEAGRLIDRLIRRRSRSTPTVLVKPRRLVGRASSDFVAIADPEIAAAVRFIRANLKEPIDVKTVLREVPISRRSLERRFEKYVGRSPSAEILRLRMERARHLLEETTLPISAVASACGFSGQEIFSVCFRRAIHTTPTDYRSRHRAAETPAAV